MNANLTVLVELGYFAALPFGNGAQVMYFLRARNRSRCAGVPLKRLASAARYAIRNRLNWEEA